MKWNFFLSKQIRWCEITHKWVAGGSIGVVEAVGPKRLLGEVLIRSTEFSTKDEAENHLLARAAEKNLILGWLLNNPETPGVF
jgi:hypothetical protein